MMRNKLRACLQASAIVAVLSGPAAAQMGIPSMSMPLQNDKTMTPEEKEKQQATDSAYSKAISKIPEQQTGGADPWGGIRQKPEPHPKKTAAKKPGQ